MTEFFTFEHTVEDGHNRTIVANKALFDDVVGLDEGPVYGALPVPEGTKSFLYLTGVSLPYSINETPEAFWVRTNFTPIRTELKIDCIYDGELISLTLSPDQIERVAPSQDSFLELKRVWNRYPPIKEEDIVDPRTKTLLFTTEQGRRKVYAITPSPDEFLALVNSKSEIVNKSKLDIKQSRISAGISRS